MTSIANVNGLSNLDDNKVAGIVRSAANIGMDPDWLAAIIRFESRFDPQARNRWSGATGLIQFMPSTAKLLGTTTEALSRMSFEEQLPYVEKYFAMAANGREFDSLSDAYMAVLWPRAVSQSDGTVLFSDPSAAYTQNAGLDRNHDGMITKEEASAQVQSILNNANGRREVKGIFNLPTTTIMGGWLGFGFAALLAAGTGWYLLRNKKHWF